MTGELSALLRFVFRLRSYLRTSITPAEGRQRMTGWMGERESSFLLLLRRAVFAREDSAYLALFRRAGIAYSDVESWMKSDGLEPTLDKLLDAGVYVTLDEFKGKCPVERSGLRLPVSAASWDNPLLQRDFEVQSTGSSSARRRVLVDLDILAQDSVALGVFLDSYGLRGSTHVIWRPIPPGSAGFKRSLQLAKLRERDCVWFSQNPYRPTWAAWKSWVFFTLALIVSRVARNPLMWPRFAPLDAAPMIAKWLQEARSAGKTVHFDTNVSSAIRVVQAAQEAGLDISGTQFRLGGEPFTAARASVFSSAGCRAVSHYSMAETGPIAMACTNATRPDDAHLLLHKIAIVARAGVEGLRAPAGIEPMFLTTLSTASPKLMINVESGDYAVREERDCGCGFGELGFRTHLHTIRSYEKLTSGGMHFIGHDLVQLVDELLPLKFGGSPTDYQFVESEERGLPVVGVRVHPRVGPVDESLLVETVLSALAGSQMAGAMMVESWRAGKVVRVLREEPVANASSKILALEQRR